MLHLIILHHISKSASGIFGALVLEDGFIQNLVDHKT